MKLSGSNRQIITVAILLLYFTPIFLFIAYSISQMSANKSWAILSTGLFVLVIGTLAFTVLLLHWEKICKSTFEKMLLHKPVNNEKETKVTSLDASLRFDHVDLEAKDKVFSMKSNLQEMDILQSSLNEKQNDLAKIHEELSKKEIELKTLQEENKDLKLQAEQYAQDLSDYKLFTEEQIKQKNLQNAALQQIIEDQRSEVDKRQEQISQLDTKVHDLSYEIKTLLHLNENDTPITPSYPKISAQKTPLHLFVEETPYVEQNSEPMISNENPIGNANEAILLLRKCVNVAQKLTGANYYSNESTRFREFSSSHFSIDQRRLFDSLRAENGGLVVVYSQKENKLVFVNNQSKNLLGWSAEKFVSEFPGFIQDGMNEWKKALGQLLNQQETQARILAKTKHGHEVILNCHLGTIPTGLFRNYVIGVLYPS